MKFKIDDKVMCVRGYRKDGYDLREGAEYTVEVVNELVGTYNLKEIRGSWCESRFIPAKQKQSMNNKKIAIKVGNNQELSRIVQEFLFSKGYGWVSEKNYKNWPEAYGSQGCIIFELESKCLYHGSSEGDSSEIYDAATQFGEIIALFSEPPKPVIKIKNDAGAEYEADFVKNPGYVTFGCAKISTGTFVVLNEALNTKVAPDSKGVEQIKIGRGLFSPTDIEVIVEHPDFKT